MELEEQVIQAVAVEIAKQSATASWTGLRRLLAAIFRRSRATELVDALDGNEQSAVTDEARNALARAWLDRLRAAVANNPELLELLREEFSRPAREQATIDVRQYNLGDQTIAPVIGGATRIELAITRPDDLEADR